MTIRDYITKEIKNMKDRPLKERWEYFWDYYKWPTLCILLAIIVIIPSIVSAVTKKNPVFSGFVLNSMPLDYRTEYLEEFYAYAGIDAENDCAIFNADVSITDGKSESDVACLQRILASLAIKDADFVLAPSNAFHVCTYNTSNMFADLRDYLDEETLQKLEGHIYYKDAYVTEQILNHTYNTLEFPDPFKPEEMKDPIPIGIHVGESPKLHQAYLFLRTDLYIGITINTQHPEMVLKYIDFLLADCP